MKEGDKKKPSKKMNHKKEKGSESCVTLEAK